MSLSSMFGSLMSAPIPKVEADAAVAVEEAVLRGAATGLNRAAERIGLTNYKVESDLRGVPALTFAPSQVIAIEQAPPVVEDSAPPASVESREEPVPGRSRRRRAV